MKVFVILILLAFLFISGCSLFRWNENKFAVSIKYQGDNAEAELQNVSVIIGSDKFWWANIKPGEEKSVNLYVEKNIKASLTLIFEINGEQKSWESNSFNEKTNYNIDLTVDSKGSVKHIIESN